MLSKNKIRGLGLFVLATASLIAFQNLSLVGPSEVGVANSVTFVRGQIAGSCMYQLNSSFAAMTVPAQNTIAWPMLSCDAQMNAKCADGYQVMNETPVQMNCDTNPSSKLTNCYWATKRCVSTTGSTRGSHFVRGQSYGGCLTQLDNSYKVTSVDYTAWPMLSCNTDGTTTCEQGFQAVNETPVQMNCSTNPSKTNALNCYWMSTRCVKL